MHKSSHGSVIRVTASRRRSNGGPKPEPETIPFAHGCHSWLMWQKYDPSSLEQPRTMLCTPPPMLFVPLFQLRHGYVCNRETTALAFRIDQKRPHMHRSPPGRTDLGQIPHVAHLATQHSIPGLHISGHLKG